MMALSNKNSMIISQHTRTTYDQNGAVKKIDQMRSIRRKDVQATFLPSQKQQNSSDLKQNQNKITAILRAINLVALVICLFAFVFYRWQNTHEQISVSRYKNQTYQNNHSFCASNKENCTDLIDLKQSYELQTKKYYSQFSQQMQKIKQISKAQQDNKEFKFNELRNILKINDKKYWQQFTQEFIQTLNCKIQHNKILCEHEF